MSRLAGKVCVVNGAASEIGRVVAGRFAGEGAVVVGVDQAGHTSCAGMAGSTSSTTTWG
jgi:NAD(P)-dependent dehydrogenase (short-subunit alcohol dehydrogenase family)